MHAINIVYCLCAESVPFLRVLLRVASILLAAPVDSSFSLLVLSSQNFCFANFTTKLVSLLAQFGNKCIG